LVDRVGRRATLMVMGSRLMVPVHLLLGLTRVNPIVSMIVLGRLSCWFLPASGRPYRS